MPKVLISDPIPQAMAQQFQAMLPANAVVDVVPTLDAADFAAHAADADVLVLLMRRLDAPTLALAPRIRFVQRSGVGYDNVDVAAAAAAGVTVAYTPGANAGAVAEHTILLMLALLRHLLSADQSVRMGGWPQMEMLQAGFGSLAGATVGLVGLGHIGQAVAARLAGFETQLLYTSRHRVDATIETRLGVTYRSLPDLLAASSIVSLHLPLTAETRGLIGEAQIAQMRRGALLINTSRGGVVVEDALLAALERGHLGGAGLDVLEHELDPRNPFSKRPDVIVTPHIGGASRGSTLRTMQMCADNVARFVAGETPLDLVPGTRADVPS